MLQVMALPFIFIPISTLNYVGVPLEKNNQISRLSNFARNIGGSRRYGVADDIFRALGAGTPVEPCLEPFRGSTAVATQIERFATADA